MRNPTRRSKRIGQTQGGRVSDGKAQDKRSRIFTRTTWTKLSAREDGTLIIRENPSRDLFHPASPDDVRRVLDRLPYVETLHVKAVVLRRTPRDDLRGLVEARRRYSVVILNAFPKSMQDVWTKKPDASTVRHMAPWCDRWIEADGCWTLQWTTDELQRYYLFHLLLHEIGHINDIHKRASKRSQATKHREAFAENYALSWARRLGGVKP